MMAVYNEEPVLEEKLNSIFENDYPLDKIQILIGSDNSTDNTNQILQKYAGALFVAFVTVKKVIRLVCFIVFIYMYII